MSEGGTATGRTARDREGDRDRGGRSGGGLHGSLGCVVGGVGVEVRLDHQILLTELGGEDGGGGVAVAAHRLVGGAGAGDEGHHLCDL